MSVRRRSFLSISAVVALLAGLAALTSFLGPTSSGGVPGESLGPSGPTPLDHALESAGAGADALANLERAPIAPPERPAEDESESRAAERDLEPLARLARDRRALPELLELLEDPRINPRSLKFNARQKKDLHALLVSTNRDLSSYESRRRRIQSDLATRKLRAGETIDSASIRTDSPNHLPGTVYVSRGTPQGVRAVALYPGEFEELEAIKLEGESIALAGLGALADYVKSLED